MAIYHFIFGGEQAMLAAGFSKRLLLVTICIAVGAAVYIAAAFLLKAIDPDDLPARFRRTKAHRLCYCGSGSCSCISISNAARDNPMNSPLFTVIKDG